MKRGWERELQKMVSIHCFCRLWRPSQRLSLVKRNSHRDRVVLFSPLQSFPPFRRMNGLILMCTWLILRGERRLQQTDVLLLVFEGSRHEPKAKQPKDIHLPNPLYFTHKYKKLFIYLTHFYLFIFFNISFNFNKNCQIKILHQKKSYSLNGYFITYNN